MAERREAHVIPAREGWEVVEPGRKEASSRHTTQREAVDRAKELLRSAGGGEAVIHGRDGRIKESDTIPSGRNGKSRAVR